MKIYISNEGWELIEAGVGCNAYPKKTALNTPNEFISVNLLRELRDEYYNRNQSLGLKTFNEFISKLTKIIGDE